MATLSGPSGPLVIGIDAGATVTRGVLATVSGSLAGRGYGGGANINSSGVDPVASLTEALRQALGDLDPATVAAGVFGIAGAGAAGYARAHAAATAAWRGCGLAGEPEVVSDIVVAFASGSPAPYGTVLIAGTGAVAAAIRDAAIIRRCDGYGWLVGDEGSAVWLGRQGVRAALDARDGRGDPTRLAEEVPLALLGGPPPKDADGYAQAIVKAVYGRPPAELGRLAPIVTAAATTGDRVAARICGAAADRLLAAVDTVRSAVPPDGPIVVAGSVLASGPVADAVHAGLRQRFDTEPMAAGDGALGAAGLALRHLTGDPAAHARLLNAATPSSPT